MKQLLPYKLFCQRKNFSIEKFLKNFPDASYEKFLNFLSSRSIQVPPEEEFLKFKTPIEQLDKPVVPKKEEQVKVEIVEKEVVEIETQEKEVINTEVNNVVEETPKPKRKRRTKKNLNTND